MGHFTMGSWNFLKNAQPPHEVHISEEFYVSEYLVTQKLWRDVTGIDFKTQMEKANKSIDYGVGPNYPMYYVNWFDACKFMDLFNCILRTIKPDYHASLPTEAQWEYACRAGTNSPYSWGDELNGTQANCNGNYPYGMYELGPFRAATSPVGSFQPNPWGLYDMHGNVWEWCLDDYSEDFYYFSPKINPICRIQTGHKVIRGGGWRSFAWCCRSAFRDSDPPEYYGRTLGFRIAITKDTRNG